MCFLIQLLSQSRDLVLGEKSDRVLRDGFSTGGAGTAGLGTRLVRKKIAKKKMPIGMRRGRSGRGSGGVEGWKSGGVEERRSG